VSDKRLRERSRFAKFAKVVLLKSDYMNIIPNELKRNVNFILPLKYEKSSHFYKANYCVGE